MFSPKPLSTRLDQLIQPPGGEREGATPCHLPSKTGSGFSFPLPVYFRILHDSQLSEGLPEALAITLADLGFPWLDTLGISSPNNAGRIVAIECDSPIDSAVLCQGSGVQLQLYGVPFQHIASNKFARWTPALPIELDSIEQLVQKLDAIRFCVGPNVPVGAAVIATDLTVYEDVRLLIDSGVDWIELVQAPSYDLTDGATLAFGEIETVITRALKARQDAASKAPLWVTSSSTDPNTWMKWFDKGIQGVSADSYLASKRPASAIPSDTLAGIRVQAVRSTKDHGWVVAALRSLKLNTMDLVAFRS